MSAGRGAQCARGSVQPQWRHALPAPPQRSAAARCHSQEVGCSNREPDTAVPRQHLLCVSRRTCGMALGAAALALQARPAQALLMAPPGLQSRNFCYCLMELEETVVFEQL